MKKYLLIAVLSFATLPLFGSGPASKEQPKNQNNDFSMFILEKSKQYTETAEKNINYAVDAIIKETPETVEQFLRWRFWQNALKFLMPFCAMILICSTLIFIIWRKIRSGCDWGADLLILVGGGVTFIMTMLTLANISSIYTCIQIVIAPRIYLIEEAIKLLK